MLHCRSPWSHSTDRGVIVWTVSVCARRTPLHAAAFAEDVAGLQLVLRHGTEINAVDNSGCSALMVAADKGHSGTVGKSLTRYSCGFLMCRYVALLLVTLWLV